MTARPFIAVHFQEGVEEDVMDDGITCADATLHGKVVERKDGLYLGIETQCTSGGVRRLVGMDGGEEVGAIDLLGLYDDMMIVAHGVGHHL